MKNTADIERQITALQLFNEKTEKLTHLSFVESITSPNTGVTIRGERKDNGSFELSSEQRGPSSEAIDAFILTFRFFIQDNERSSFRKIAAVYDTADIDEELKVRFRSAREAINKLLDSPNLLNINYNGATPTNREIMEVFTYGGLAHANHEKYQRYKEWMSVPFLANLLETCFTFTLGHILQAIIYISNINQQAIKELKSKM